MPSMEQIGRRIYIKTTTSGTYFTFLNENRQQEDYLNQSMAEDARRRFDFFKPYWTQVGVNTAGNDYHWHKTRKKSTVRYDHYYEMYYAQQVLRDDILVTKPYPTRKEARTVKDYLDSEDWSIQALNLQIKRGAEIGRKYAGILPLKKGYLLVDLKGNEWGVKQTLEEAYETRNILRQEGVSI